MLQKFPPLMEEWVNLCHDSGPLSYSAPRMWLSNFHIRNYRRMKPTPIQEKESEDGEKKCCSSNDPYRRRKV